MGIKTSAILLVDDERPSEWTVYVEPSAHLSIKDTSSSIKVKNSVNYLSTSVLTHPNYSGSSTLRVASSQGKIEVKVASALLRVKNYGIGKLRVREGRKVSSTHLRPSFGVFQVVRLPSKSLLKVTKEGAGQVDYKAACAYLKVTHPLKVAYTVGSKVLRVDSSKFETSIKAYGVLKVYNIAPDYLSILSECEGLRGEIPELKIPVKVGEFSEIAIFEGEEIEKIYRKPFSIAYEGNKIFGRLVTQNEVTMEVRFKSGKVIKLTLVPYLSDFVRVLISK